MSSTSRHGLCVLLLSPFALAALCAPAQAQEVQTDLTGTVLAVSLSPSAPPGTDGELSELGVVTGANATVTYRVESSTPPIINGEGPDFTNYQQAITSMTIQIGGYSCTLFTPPGFESLNLIQVGDDVPGSPVSDSYLLSTPASEKSGLLHGAAPGWPTMSVALFDFSGPNASNDEGVIQDAKKYDFGNAVVGGVNGSINIMLDLGSGGGGGGNGVGPGFCRKFQLLAAGKLGRKAFNCTAKSAKQPPEKDPQGEKALACVNKAAALFEKQFSKGVQKTSKKGGTCTLSSTGAETVTDDLLLSLNAVALDVLAGADTADKKDRALRGKLLRAAAGQWAKDAAAYARNEFKPSPEKLSKKLGKSRSRLEARVAKAIMAAEKKGVVYAGPDGPALADAVRAAVEEFLLVTGGSPAPD